MYDNYTSCIHYILYISVLLLLINYILCRHVYHCILVYTNILTCALNLNLAGSCLSLSPSTPTTSTTSACLESMPMCAI